MEIKFLNSKFNIFKGIILFLIILFSSQQAYSVNIGYDNAANDHNTNLASKTIRYATQIIPSSNVTITKLGVTQPTGSGSLGRILLAIYSDNGSNLPNTLLGQTTAASMSYGGGNLEINLVSSVNLTSGTKYWIQPFDADGNQNYIGFSYKCSGGNYAYFINSSAANDPATPPSSWSSLPSTGNGSSCGLGHYAVTGSSNVLPTLSSSVPADDAPNIARDANIVLNFSEIVNKETGNITIKKTSDNSIVETIDVTSSKVTGDGTTQITINPTSDFFGGFEYYVLIDATAFDDVSSGSYAGISSTTALSFTTANTLPILSSSVPADDAPNIARDANIVLNFSEIVNKETGNITIKKTSDNSIVETIDVTSSKVTGDGTTQITINPTSDFFGGFEYYVLIDATAFDDVSSGSYAGISSTTALSFTVESMVDPITDKDVTRTIGVQSQLAKNTFTQSVRMVSNRLSHLRQNKDSQNLSKNNIKLDFGNATFTSLANELLAKNDKSIIPDNWSSWSEGSISVTKIGDSTNSSSSETDGQSLAIGFDTKLNDNDLLGFAIQYGKSDTDVGSSGTNVESENYNLSVYRTRPLNDDNFIEGSIGIGVIESDLKRVSGSNTLTGSRDGTQVFGSINYGKTIDKGDFNLTPIGRVDLGYTELDAYSETGTDALSYAKQTIESGLASLGLEFSDIVKLNKNSFKPFGSIEYGLDFSNSSDAKMNYVSDTSTIYTYTQGINSNHLITSVVGFEYITKDNLEIISSYKRIQGNESEKTDIIKFGVNFKSKQETEYAMSIDGSEDLKAGFDISKNINGFDLIFNANQAFNENSDQTANVSLTKKF